MDKIFVANNVKPIIAFDFDGCITARNIYPEIAEPRKYAKEVMNFLYGIGVIVAVWTCRENSSCVPDYHPNYHPDKTLAMEYLKDNEIKYHTMNTIIEHAPFHYESRKIYANMYVDDNGFGWEDTDCIMLKVLNSFMSRVLKVPDMICHDMVEMIIHHYLGNYSEEECVREFYNRIRRYEGYNGYEG